MGLRTKITGNASLGLCAMRGKTGKGPGLLVHKPEKYMDSKMFIVSILTDL